MSAGSDARLRQHPDASLHKEDHGWLVDFFQTRWILRIEERNDSDSCFDCLRPFLLRQRERLSRDDRLRGKGAHPRGFEFGEARLKHTHRRAVMVDQFLDARSAECCGQTEREPADALVGSHGSNCNGKIRRIGIRHVR